MGELYENTLFGKVLSRRVVNDNIYTPDELAKAIVKYFKPKGKILEPCKGGGAFIRALPKHTEWCELEEKRNFFQYKEKVDWIITNPPFSKISDFLKHSMKLSPNVVFLINVAALFTVHRIRAIHSAGFWIKEIRFVKQPETFVQTGRIPAAVYFKKGTPYNTIFTFEKNCFTKFNSSSKSKK